MKVTFTMASPDPKKHSTRFNFEKLEEADEAAQQLAGLTRSFRPSFYIPLPFAADADRIRVTIEVV